MPHEECEVGEAAYKLFGDKTSGTIANLGRKNITAGRKDLCVAGLIQK
jgi:hypothetical protein